MSWAQDAVFYHIYPLGFCGAPEYNDFGAPVQRLEQLVDAPHAGGAARCRHQSCTAGPLSLPEPLEKCHMIRPPRNGFPIQQNVRGRCPRTPYPCGSGGWSMARSTRPSTSS